MQQCKNCTKWVGRCLLGKINKVASDFACDDSVSALESTQTNKKVLTKEQAKCYLTYVGYYLRRSTAKNFEITLVIKELPQ